MIDSYPGGPGEGGRGGAGAPPDVPGGAQTVVRVGFPSPSGPQDCLRVPEAALHAAVPQNWEVWGEAAERLQRLEERAAVLPIGKNRHPTNYQGFGFGFRVCW